MIILAWAAAGAAAAHMISREHFAFYLEKFSLWEVSIRLLSAFFLFFLLSKGGATITQPVYTHTHTNACPSIFVRTSPGKMYNSAPDP